MRISVSAIWTCIVAYPISTAKHVIITSWVCNARNVATARAYAIRVIFVIPSRAADDTLQYTVIVEPEGVWPGASAHTRVGERIAIESSAICGASVGKVVVACSGVADADAVDHHLVGRAGSAI